MAGYKTDRTVTAETADRMRREAWDSPIFANLTDAALYMWLLDHAAIEPRTVMTQRGPVAVAAGELVVSERKLAADFNLSRAVVHDGLARLRNAGLISAASPAPARAFDARSKTTAGSNTYVMKFLIHSPKTYLKDVAHSTFGTTSRSPPKRGSISAPKAAGKTGVGAMLFSNKPLTTWDETCLINEKEPCSDGLSQQSGISAPEAAGKIPVGAMLFSDKTLTTQDETCLINEKEPCSDGSSQKSDSSAPEMAGKTPVGAMLGAMLFSDKPLTSLDETCLINEKEPCMEPCSDGLSQQTEKTEILAGNTAELFPHIMMKKERKLVRKKESKKEKMAVASLLVFSENQSENETPGTASPGSAEEAHQAMEIWNDWASRHDMPGVSLEKTTAAYRNRLGGLRRVLTEIGGIGALGDLLERCSRSSFLMGKKGGWRMDLTWLCVRPVALERIMSGFYDRSSHTEKKKLTGWDLHHAGWETADRLDAKLRAAMANSEMFDLDSGTTPIYEGKCEEKSR